MRIVQSQTEGNCTKIMIITYNEGVSIFITGAYVTSEGKPNALNQCFGVRSFSKFEEAEERLNSSCKNWG